MSSSRCSHRALSSLRASSAIRGTCFSGKRCLSNAHERAESFAGTNDSAEMVDFLFNASASAQAPAPRHKVSPSSAEKQGKERAGSRTSSIIVRVNGEARRMPDYLAVVREIEKRFGRVRDFRLQKDTEVRDQYMGSIYLNFADVSSVDKIRVNGVESFHLTIPSRPSPSAPSALNSGSPLSEVQKYLNKTPTEETTSGSECECVIRISDKPLSTTYLPKTFSPTTSQAVRRAFHRELVAWGGFYPHEFRTEGPVQPVEPSYSSRRPAEERKPDVDEAQALMEGVVQQSRVELFKLGDPTSRLVKNDGVFEFAVPSKAADVEAEPIVEGDTITNTSVETASTKAGVQDKGVDSEEIEFLKPIPAPAPEPVYVEPLSTEEKEEFKRLFRSLHGQGEVSVSEKTSPSDPTSPSPLPSTTASAASPQVSHDGTIASFSEEDNAQGQILNNRARRAHRKSQQKEESQPFAKRLLGWMGR